MTAHPRHRPDPAPEVSPATAAGQVSQTASAPTVPFISHVAPVLRDITYDHRAAQAALPVEVHYRNGATVPALVVLDPAEMERWHMQLGRALDAREKAQGRA